MVTAILSAIVTVVLGVLAEGLGAHWNLPGIGSIVSIAVMGAIIILLIEQKKK